MKPQYTYSIDEAEELTDEEIDEIALILAEMGFHYFYGKVNDEKILNSL